MRKSNLTYDQLIELAPKDRPFQIEVESNPFGEGVKRVLWGYLYQDSKDTELDTGIANQGNIDKVAYNNRVLWRTHYKGKFTLIDEYRNMYEKPEVLEVGTEVEILESVRDCGVYDEKDDEKDIGKVGKIVTVEDIGRGLSYTVQFNHKLFYTFFPHYCVRPVEKVEEKEEDIITVNGKKYKLIEDK